MNNRSKYLFLLMLSSVTPTTMAVHLSQNGLGEVLIYPYYTVNNDLNTLYSVINTTDQAKAISVRFQEGEFGYDVLNFSIYLDAYDVWTGALAAVDSTITGHIDEPSVLHLTADTSCAPFLVKSGQEFLPFQIELDGNFNDNLQRAREGQLLVMEMGVLPEGVADAVDHQNTGVPADCGLIENDWADDGIWSFGDLGDPTGGILGSATIVNVAEGLAFPYDAVALQNYWQGAGQHPEPGSELPNLTSASPQSLLLLDNGDLSFAEWENGYEAVSAVLMSTEIYNEYALDSIVVGKSEWVVTFPTKKHHTIFGSPARAPFNSVWFDQQACEIYNLVVVDREEQTQIINELGVGGQPRPDPTTVCYFSNVIEFLLPGVNETASTGILGSSNHQIIATTPDTAVTESGWAKMVFSRSEHRMISVNGITYLGLPTTGFVVQQFTNAGAAEGLLAQYGNLFMHKGSVMVDSGE